MKKSRILTAIAAAALLAACSGGVSTWQLSGKVANAPEGAKIAVEQLTGYGWTPIDSVTLASDGSFSFTAPEGLPFHDIFRVSYGGKNVYFPIDSLDHVTLDTDAATFDTGYTLGGTPLAQTMMDIDGRINSALRDHGAQYVLTDSAFRRELGQAIVNDTTGIVAYYYLNRRVAGRPLFSTDNLFDVRIYGAVANCYQRLRPADPRALTLAAVTTQARRQLGTPSGAGTSVEASMAGFIDIDLLDETGAHRTLSQTVEGAGVTILNFSAYEGNDVSLLMNTELNRLAESFKDQGLAIYQVSIDANEPEWTKVARNLPWTTVWAGSGDAVAVLGNYNLINAPLPVSFIINGRGELVERVTTEDLANDEKALEKAVRRAL